ncbi:transposase [Caldicoprobacter guelmensis]|uniref:transposase n=1 Tax=Caldicoprobacter guelmensis TaxID=1170224 RepID=UPI0019577FD3|nr:transposase [Caldicoprobacter guelmensis]
MRVILVRFRNKDGNLTYTMLYTNISREKLSCEEAFHFYNGRQTIEAFFKMAKNIYGIKNLRTSKFYGIYTFLLIMAMTHNLITWFKEIKLGGSELREMGVKTLVKKCSRVKGFVERTAEGIHVTIPPLTKLARLLIEALTRPRYVQLSFLI